MNRIMRLVRVEFGEYANGANEPRLKAPEIGDNLFGSERAVCRIGENRPRQRAKHLSGSIIS